MSTIQDAAEEVTAGPAPDHELQRAGSCRGKVPERPLPGARRPVALRRYLDKRKREPRNGTPSSPARFCSGRVGEGGSELAVGEHALGLALELPDPLARDAELVAELGQRRDVAVVEAVPAEQHVLMAL